MPAHTANQTWYEAGLRFQCTQCGNCCSGPPGYVFVTTEEVARIAAFLGRSDGTLDRSMLRTVGRRRSLVEHANGDCVFLRTEHGQRTCAIYPVRPLQCRSWPFWEHLLDSPENWADASRTCPGINQGPTLAFVQIERRRSARTWDEAAS